MTISEILHMSSHRHFVTVVLLMSKDHLRSRVVRIIMTEPQFYVELLGR